MPWRVSRDGKMPLPGQECSLGSSQVMVSISECLCKSKSGLNSHTKHISIVVFTNIEQMLIHKVNASAVEPVYTVMQLSPFPIEDLSPHLPIPSVSKGWISFIQREELPLHSFFLWTVWRKSPGWLLIDPPQVGRNPSFCVGLPREHSDHSRVDARGKPAGNSCPWQPIMFALGVYLPVCFRQPSHLS